MTATTEEYGTKGEPTGPPQLTPGNGNNDAIILQCRSQCLFCYYHERSIATVQWVHLMNADLAPGGRRAEPQTTPSAVNPPVG